MKTKPEMNLTNGCGTTYLGAYEIEKDGSFITTEWEMLFYIPISYNKSYRVLYVKEEYSYNFISSKSKTYYKILAETKVNKKHIYVVRSFLCIGIMVFMASLIASNLYPKNKEELLQISGLSLSFSFFAPYLILKYFNSNIK